MANKTKRFRLLNFQGGLNTIAEENALISLDPNAMLGVGLSQIRTELRRIDNFFPTNRGGLSKGTGFTLYKNVGTSTPITGIYRHIESDGTTNHMLVTYGTKIDKLISGTLTNLSTGLTSGAYPSFATGNDVTVICDGTIAPLKYDGSTVGTLGGSPPTGATQALFYQNRMWLAKGSYLYYSDANAIETGYASNFVQCDFNDGQNITHIAPFFIPGQLEPVILVGKDRSTGIVTGLGTTDSPYTFKKIRKDSGIPGFRQSVQFGDDIAFLTPQGVTSYRTSLENVNLKNVFISEPIQDKFFALSASTLPKAHAWLDWKRNLACFAVAEGSSTYPNAIYCYDTSDGGWYKQSGFNITTAFVDTDGTVYHGDEAGNIYNQGSTYNSYNGNPINAIITTPYFDFFEPDRNKRIVQASIVARGNGAYNFGIGCSKNFGANLGSSHTVEIDAGAYVWGGGVWTSDPSVYRWGGEPIVRKDFYPSGIFKNIALTLSQSGVNQPLDILEINLLVEYLSSY